MAGVVPESSGSLEFLGADRDSLAGIDFWQCQLCQSTGFMRSFIFYFIL